jgi:hypothetical protein
VVQHAVDGLEVLFRLVVQTLSLGFKLGETKFGVDVDRILCDFAHVESLLELLGSLEESQRWTKADVGERRTRVTLLVKPFQLILAVLVVGQAGLAGFRWSCMLVGEYEGRYLER